MALNPRSLLLTVCSSWVNIRALLNDVTQGPRVTAICLNMHGPLPEGRTYAGIHIGLEVTCIILFTVFCPECHMPYPTRREPESAICHVPRMEVGRTRNIWQIILMTTTARTTFKEIKNLANVFLSANCVSSPVLNDFRAFFHVKYTRTYGMSCFMSVFKTGKRWASLSCLSKRTESVGGQVRSAWS